MAKTKKTKLGKRFNRKKSSLEKTVAKVLGKKVGLEAYKAQRTVSRVAATIGSIFR